MFELTEIDGRYMADEADTPRTPEIEYLLRIARAAHVLSEAWGIWQLGEDVQENAWGYAAVTDPDIVNAIVNVRLALAGQPLTGRPA